MACMGEIRLFAFNFAPKNWEFCDGTVLTIANNERLFSLLENKYGGDGINTFALPDMRGRVPVGVGRGKGLSKNWQLGEKFGEEKVALTDGNLPIHRHSCKVSSDEGDTDEPSDNFFSSVKGKYKIYNSLLNDQSEVVSMHSNSITYTGDNKPHENMMPTVALNYCICTNGVDPRREEVDWEVESIIGEIKIFANTFAPAGFRKCDGSKMDLHDEYNRVLFSVLNSAYDGNSINYFNVPNLQGKVLSHRSTELWFANAKGSIDAEVTLANMPSHNHYMQVSPKKATESVISANVVPAIGNTSDGRNVKIIDIYCNNTKLDQASIMNQEMLSKQGKGENHENRQPYLALNYCICVDGDFPFRP
ncbi:MAG: tail fiber protein [Aliarcobacter sp.]|nr:tail fiber protein [Aliarcobacter sp.]